MRKQLYTAIKSRLLESGLIAHVDLWNQNTNFLEQEQAWALPAVFIEFGEIEWQPIKNKTFRCRASVLLHIVTEWNIEADTLDAFDLIDNVRAVLSQIENTTDFGNLQLSGSQTNHNHEDLLESIEQYAYTGILTIADVESETTNADADTSGTESTQL